MQGPARTAALLLNPAAGRARPGLDVGRVAAYLERRGISTDVVHSRSPAHATEAARDAARAGRDLFFVIGGDGTVRDAAAGLVGSQTALAALPGGTVNVWCREVDIPLGLRAAVDSHITGRVVRADLGRVNGEPFLLMASAGWDAEIARRISPRLKARLADYAYIVQAAAALPRMRPITTRWYSGMARFDRDIAVLLVSNTRVYGGRIQPNPRAFVNDGILDLLALCPANPMDFVRIAMKLARGSAEGDPAVVTDRVSDITIETPGIPIQADGDYICDTPASFTVDAAALAVSIPAGPLPAIFHDEGGATRPRSA